MSPESRVILVDDLIEKSLLGTVALVSTSIPVPGGHPGSRSVAHDPHPCDTVFLYSLSLNCEILKPKCLALPDIASQCRSLPALTAAFRRLLKLPL